MVVYDDVKRAKMLKLATDVQEKLQKAGEDIMSNEDLNLDEKMEMLNMVLNERRAAKSLYNTLDVYFQPTAAAPP